MWRTGWKIKAFPARTNTFPAPAACSAFPSIFLRLKVCYTSKSPSFSVIRTSILLCPGSTRSLLPNLFAISPTQLHHSIYFSPAIPKYFSAQIFLSMPKFLTVFPTLISSQPNTSAQEELPLRISPIHSQTSFAKLPPL